MVDYKGRMRFGNKTRNQRYRQILNATAGDPEWANVQLLIGEGGADGETVVDESSASRTVTVSGVGSGLFDNSQQVYGDVSARIATSTFAFFEVAHDATNMDVTGTWTCDMRVRWDAHTIGVQLMNKGDNLATSGFEVLILGNGTMQTAGWDGAQGVVVNEIGVALLDDTWYDITVEKNGLVWTTFVDGEVYTQATASGEIVSIDNTIQWGHSRLSSYNVQAAPDIWYDELRWTQGVARYEGSAYTIAGAAFPRS